MVLGVRTSVYEFGRDTSTHNIGDGGIFPYTVPASWAELRLRQIPPGGCIPSEALTSHFTATPFLYVCVCVCVCVCMFVQCVSSVLCLLCLSHLIMSCSGGRDHILVIFVLSSQAMLCRLKFSIQWGNIFQAFISSKLKPSPVFPPPTSFTSLNVICNCSHKN